MPVPGAQLITAVYSRKHPKTSCWPAHHQRFTTPTVQPKIQPLEGTPIGRPSLPHFKLPARVAASIVATWCPQTWSFGAALLGPTPSDHGFQFDLVFSFNAFQCMSLCVLLNVLFHFLRPPFWGHGMFFHPSSGLVASASEPGRIFCNAFEVNGTMETFITGTLVREPNYFAILTSGGSTVSITVGGLLPMTEYEAWLIGDQF